MTTTTSYHAVNAVGVTVHTFDANMLDKARKWVGENAHTHAYGALHLEEVTTTVTSRRVYRPRPKTERGPLNWTNAMAELGLMR